MDYRKLLIIKKNMRTLFIYTIMLLLGGCGLAGKITSEKKEEVQKAYRSMDSLSLAVQKQGIKVQTIRMQTIEWSKPDSSGLQHMETTTDMTFSDEKKEEVITSIEKKERINEEQKKYHSQNEAIEKKKSFTLQRILWLIITITLVYCFIKRKLY